MENDKVKAVKKMENPDQDKGNGKLLGICKILLKIYQKLQSHSKASQWAQRKEEIEMEKETSGGIWRTKREDYKLTCTCTTKKKRKILSENRCVRTCYRRSFIPGVRRKMETYCIFVKDNATHWKELCVMVFKLKGLSKRTTLVLSNIRELDRDPFTK